MNCSYEIRKKLFPDSPAPGIAEYISPRRMYFHGFEISNTVNTTVTVQFGNGTDAEYREDGQTKVFEMSAGQWKRFFAWPIIG